MGQETAVTAQSDIDAIVTGLVEQRLAHLAASVRAQSGQVEVPQYYDDPLPYSSSGRVLADHGMHRVPAPCRSLEAPHRAWWQAEWVRKAQIADLKIGLGIGAVFTVIHFLALWINSTIGLAGLASLGALVVVARLLSACTCGCGGRRVTGSFTGRIE